jgi:hypothetical protein
MHHDLREWFIKTWFGSKLTPEIKSKIKTDMKRILPYDIHYTIEQKDGLVLDLIPRDYYTALLFRGVNLPGVGSMDTIRDHRVNYSWNSGELKVLRVPEHEGKRYGFTHEVREKDRLRFAKNPIKMNYESKIRGLLKEVI